MLPIVVDVVVVAAADKGQVFAVRYGLSALGAIHTITKGR